MGQPDALERTIARDFVMARLAACRANLSAAVADLDMVVNHFVAPETDKRGKSRATLLEQIDELIGEAAQAVQAAQEGWDDVDPAEGEPAPEDEEDEDGDDDGNDGDEDEDEDEDEGDESDDEED